MKLSSYLLVTSKLDRYETHEMYLAARLIKGTPDNGITLFNKKFYSLALRHHWQKSGGNRQFCVTAIILKVFG